MTARRLLLGIAGTVVLALAVVVAAVVGWGNLGFADGTAAPSPDTTAPPATVAVTKATLTQTQSVTGILSYGVPAPLIAQGTSGVVTWIASPGSVVNLGEPVYTVNGKPVILIHGKIPPYRTLEPGLVGPDVKQLEQSLHDLGYLDFIVDETYDGATAAAVWTWQYSLGLETTGVVPVDQIAVVPSNIRIATQTLPVGSHLGPDSAPTILTYSGTKKFVTIPLDVSLQHLVTKGDTATVVLPDGTDVKAKVSSIGKVAQTIEDKQFVTVNVTLTDQSAVPDLEAAPVTLKIVTGQRKNVLTVPVNALVALEGGGYGLEVVANGQSTYLAVKTGMFANGLVEVSGTGIAEGTLVGVAK